MRQQQGFSLIEVLVAALVIALGILAMIAMQVNATRLTKTSEIRTLGAMLAGDLADRMRANRTGFLSGNYTLTTKYPNAPTSTDSTKAIACNGSAKLCTTQEIAQSDLADWRLAVSRALPNGAAWISTVDATDEAVDVWLIWNEATERNTSDRNGDECVGNLVKSDANVTPRCMYFRITL
ncbi:MAG: type IV pilus modification protein PilV [Aquabacterium sp.]